MSGLGSALETLGSGLMRYGALQMDKEEQLGREARADQRALALARQKVELEAQMAAAAEKHLSEQIAGAKSAQRGLLQAELDKKMAVPELKRLQGLAEQTWSSNLPPGGPVTRSGPEDESMPFADMQAADRAIYAQNLRENLDYAASKKPSEMEVNIAAARALQGTKAGQQLLKNVADELAIQKAAKDLRAAPEMKLHFNTRTGEIIGYNTAGGYEIVRRGHPADGKADKITPAQKANNAEIIGARIQVGKWTEAGAKVDMLRNDPAKAKVLDKALEHLVGPDPEFDAFYEALGRGLTYAQLQGGGGGSPAAVPLTIEMYNDARARASQIADPKNRANALRELEAAARQQKLIK